MPTSSVSGTLIAFQGIGFVLALLPRNDRSQNMYVSLQSRHVPFSSLLRWSARASGAILVVAWLALVILETTRPNVDALHVAAFYQAAALALVFAGYALGWRMELAGGVVSILGTAAFFAVHVLTFGILPGLEAAWFAVPGVLYVLAWKYNEQRQNVIAQP